MRKRYRGLCCDPIMFDILPDLFEIGQNGYICSLNF